MSEEKRARVEAVIRKYDYRPNALAQGLIKTKTNVIGVLAADLVNPYYSSMVENCEKEIIARGYVPMICGTLSNPDLEVEYIQKMFDMRMDAIIIIGGKSDSLVTEPEYADLINRVAESIPVITTGKVEGGECCHDRRGGGQEPEHGMSDRFRSQAHCTDRRSRGDEIHLR